MTPAMAPATETGLEAAATLSTSVGALLRLVTVRKPLSTTFSVDALNRVDGETLESGQGGGQPKRKRRSEVGNLLKWPPYDATRRGMSSRSGDCRRPPPYPRVRFGPGAVPRRAGPRCDSRSHDAAGERHTSGRNLPWQEGPWRRQ